MSILTTTTKKILRKESRALLREEGLCGAAVPGCAPNTIRKALLAGRSSVSELREWLHPTTGHFYWLYLSRTREGNGGSENREKDWGCALKTETLFSEMKVEGSRWPHPQSRVGGTQSWNTSFRALSLPQGKESTFNEVRNLKSLFEKRHLCL